MKYKISAVLLLSLMLSMLFLPLVVAADDGKSIIKEMVQAPADYSVGLDPIFIKYGMWELDRHVAWELPGYGNIADRVWVYYPSYAFYRLSPLIFS